MFDVTDQCDNTTSGFTCTFVIVDDTKPVIDCPPSDEGEDFISLGEDPELNDDGIPAAIPTGLSYTDNCQGSGTTTDVNDGKDIIFSSQDCDYTLSRQFFVNDGCGNIATCTVVYKWTSSTDGCGDDVITSTQSINNDFIAYPVPFDNEVTLKYSFDYNTDIDIEVFDSKGAMVKSMSDIAYKTGSIGKTKVDLSRVNDQLLIVRITTSKESKMKKIVSSSPNARN